MRRTNRPTVTSRVANAVDSVVGIFAPGAQLRRQQYRAALRMLDRHRFAYDGAEKAHRLKNWVSGGGSADADLDEETLETLRERSRERMQNTSLANTVISSIQENVVGQGLVPTLDLDSDRLGISESHASELRDQATEVWDEWTPHADSANRLHMADIQALVLASVLVNGDMGVMPLQVTTGRAPSPLSLKLEMVEADRIATPDGTTSDDGVTIRNGVSIGARGQPLGYWVAQRHPGDDHLQDYQKPLKYRRIRAHNDDGSARFMHLYWQKRIGQSRGEPLFAPVLADFKNLTEFVEAELVAAQVAACFAVWVTKENPYESAIGNAGTDTTVDGLRVEEVIPGSINYGRPGESAQAVSPGRPNSQFDPFYMAVAQQIAAVSGAPLEVVTRNFRGTTYSQARAMLLEARRSYANRQSWLVRYLLGPVHDRVLYEAWLRGRFDAGDFLQRRAQWCKTTWGTPGWGHIDEEKSMKAAKLALDMRVTTRDAIARSSFGKSFEEINRELAREEEQIAAVGGEVNPPGQDEEAEADDDTADDDTEAVDDEDTESTDDQETEDDGQEDE